ncbi:NlpC/P60 family protein [Synechococcus sp. RSCCF101]|uniref:C40 family peptidase n=1 Tax=Synechococcus sp. RSCCF101 TaxID=2511069 RepID=UPI001243B825|nr:NlpC/P60 family protein [Synechococcus sp. RSCCF101]QEY32202.1 NlpC/P60 family protein [Synechococcus sp. RSCCF101]
MVSVGTPVAAELLSPGSCWRLDRHAPGYARPEGSALATEVSAGRRFQVGLHPGHRCGAGRSGTGAADRIPVRLLEDGYPCWLSLQDCLGHARASLAVRPPRPGLPRIRQRMEAVLAQALSAMERPNRYLWGGTVGPDFDCSGLVQNAFASQGIWLPRDAYQQERFCRPIAVRPGVLNLLRPGDLIFFGTAARCTHVGLHLGGGRYLHSSGREHGRDGLGIDGLAPRDHHPVACHYRRELRGAGRVERSHDGTTLP